MIRIVTDSSSALPPEFIQQHNLSVVPLTIQWGDETFAEGAGLSNRDFFRRLASADVFPTTSQPAVADFERAYRHILQEEPAAEILVLTVSSKLSGTHHTALTAATRLPEARINVFDSLSVAMGVGLMVMAAVRLAQTDRTLPEILSQLRYLRDHLPIFLTVDDLNYLKRGGRIGAAAAFLGTVLNTKPILTLEAGEIQPVARVRGQKNAIHQLFTELERQLPAPNHPVQAGVMHAGAEEAARQLGRMIQERFNITYFFLFEIGPALGTHVGPGTIGTGFCPHLA